MATQITTTDPTQPQSIRVERGSGSQALLPAIASGEVLRVTVRQNPPDGQGMIGVKGQLIKAMLPAHLNVGDKLLAQVTPSENAVILKILQVQPALPLTNLVEIAAVSTQIEQLLLSPANPGLRALPPFRLPEAFQTLERALSQLKEFSTRLPTNEALADPNLLTVQLQSAGNGSLGLVLKEAAQAVREMVEQLERQLPPLPQRFFTALHEKLTAMLEPSSRNNSQAARDILIIVNQLQQELSLVTRDLATQQLRPDRAFGGKEIETLIKDLLKDLDSSQTKQDSVRAKVENALTRLEQSLVFRRESSGRESLSTEQQNQNNPTTNPKLTGDLRQLATRLDQMAATQELMTQLNPIMQALGEPALILFPFLFHGLLSHSEVTVESRTGGKKNPHGDNEENGEGRGKRSVESYQRVQIKVPLPELGIVDVDVSHRDKEVLARFTVENAEVGGFLLEQLEGLKSILRELGFEKTELTASIGPSDNSQPAWTEGLHRRTTAIA